MKEKVSYREGQFVDYNGETHKFVVAAVSTNNIVEEGGDLCLSLYDDYGDLVDERSLDKALFIGVAVCNPKDEFDLEKGKMIAYNKAITCKDLNHPAVYTTRAGYINNEVVDALLDNIVAYIEKDPGSVIAGYNEAQKKHYKKLEDKQFIENSSDKLKALCSAIKNLSTTEKTQLDKLIKLS